MAPVGWENVDIIQWEGPSKLRTPLVLFTRHSFHHLYYILILIILRKLSIKAKYFMSKASINRGSIPWNNILGFLHRKLGCST